MTSVGPVSAAVSEPTAPQAAPSAFQFLGAPLGFRSGP
jgi:hypothetical protein